MSVSLPGRQDPGGVGRAAPDKLTGLQLWENPNPIMCHVSHRAARGCPQTASASLTLSQCGSEHCLAPGS